MTASSLAATKMLAGDFYALLCDGKAPKEKKMTRKQLEEKVRNLEREGNRTDIRFDEWIDILRRELKQRDKTIDRMQKFGHYLGKEVDAYNDGGAYHVRGILRYINPDSFRVGTTDIDDGTTLHFDVDMETIVPVQWSHSTPGDVGYAEQEK